MIAREFQHVLMAHEIGTRVGRRVLERVTHTRLRGQMQDDVVTLILRGRRERARCRDVGLHETIRSRADLGQPRVLQRRIVIGVEFIQTGDRMSRAPAMPSWRGTR